MEVQRCIYCANLSISALVVIANRGFSGYRVPAQEFYRHHRSIQDLEDSASRGCDLCQLLLEKLKLTPCPYLKDRKNSSRSMYAQGKLYQQTDIRIALGSDHVRHADSLGEVRVFDSILIRLAVGDEPVLSMETNLKIKTTRGTFHYSNKYSFTVELTSTPRTTSLRRWT